MYLVFFRTKFVTVMVDVDDPDYAESEAKRLFPKGRITYLTHYRPVWARNMRYMHRIKRGGSVLVDLRADVKRVMADAKKSVGADSGPARARRGRGRTSRTAG